MTNWVRKGDKVVVIAGNDRGKIGQILSRKKDRVTVEGVNVRKKTFKKSQQRPKGQIIDIERPIHVSKVKVCVDDKAVKLKVRFNKENERELVYKGAKKETLYRAASKPLKAK